ncbi:MAG: radical SAM protein [Candidatus Caldatribacteriaceae bacterium]
MDPLLQTLASSLYEHLHSCDLCPRLCGVNRLKGEKGFCRGGFLPRVASFHPHFGEEPLLSGSRGSGTIFFAGCNMHCVYCQNYTISQFDEGEEVSLERLAQFMLFLQEEGCHNLNLVTPTHFLPQILLSLAMARGEGFHLPLVYNTGGYERVEILRLLRGVVDIYLPDMRYSRDESGVRYSQAPRYPSFNREAIREMFSQTGEVVCNEEGVALKGVVVRILLLPSLLDEAMENLRFLAEAVSREISVSLMRQYRPTYRAFEFPELDGRVDAVTYQRVLQYGLELGLKNFILQ